ncbi:signal transduction histidine kinase, nitrogen specific, NtrB [Oleidesulfovibrio alaskensis G20]|jgi:two-component system sensor histidine kinase HydH|uniref:histidine kinase n=1 Tax=Oleidesulfovibrio alaskensis (strain ATCC BAA-1058 / DSM 17464 / G20) TaxID=207559 RepID=Q317I5_OLEA2|nr:PAS domain-containing sensor histidine kinase [Oleidesulfovibrio alaskensis]ABB36911.1 signal transduction histidine kinase, nitrogen specific, NtrB [Oleidesulfovibrio alaskensis G20]MBG0774181.1 PAS domain-containing protein [Oleidesulfovibrio alaskensis]
MHFRKKHSLPGPFASPWLVIGAAVILGVVVVALSVRNITRSEQYMANILLEKGGSLIKAFEAGARTGMRGSAFRLQVLLEEMADQPDIDFIALTDREGNIVAHSNNEQVGKRLFGAEVTTDLLRPDTRPRWSIFGQAGKRYFVVYREFAPLQGRHARRGHMMPHMRNHAWDNWQQPDGPPPIIFVGFDVQPFEDARRQDKQHTMTMAAIVLLLGVAGFISLIWAQNVRRARKELESTQALSDEIVSNLPEGLVVLDAAGDVSFMNNAARAMLGDGTAAHDAHEAAASCPPLPPVLMHAVRQLDTQHILSGRETVLSGTGGPVPVSVTGACITGEDGSLMGKLLLLHDLSEVRRLEEEVRRREKLAAIGSLAAGVAHEIRNPLSSIKGYATYFGTRFAEGSEDRDAARIMVQEVDRLNRVISDLIGLARPSDLSLKPSRPESLAENVLRLIRQDAAGKNIDLRFAAADDLPQAVLDPDRVTQALLNVCLNALDAMESGGVLTLSVDTDSTSSEGRRLLRFKVRDTGCGITPETLSTMFDPYFTTKSQGTGLGLAIVHKIVEAHGGEIAVQSSVGSGTEISLILPLEPQRNANS